MGVIVRKGTQAIKFFLAGGVPEGELDVDVIDEDVVDVVFENGGFVYCRKVPAMASGASNKLCWVLDDKTYPLVNTLSSEVLPQAPSPLYKIAINELAVQKGGETVQ